MMLAMSRAERLLELMQCLRRHRHPVSGAALAAELGVSLRTLYRDIASLQAQGAAIDGAAGLGYVLRPGFLLPPLMFGADEVEALVLGSRWVAERTDPALALAARNALAKIAAVLPAPQRHELDTAPLLVGPAADNEPMARLTVLRRAIRAQHKLAVDYCDLQGQATQRTIWPFALGFFDRVSVVVGWCELRGGLRHLRTDRITALTALEERYPRRREDLMREWRESQGMAS